MHHYGKAVGDVEQINSQLQQPMVAACAATVQFLWQLLCESSWSSKSHPKSKPGPGCWGQGRGVQGPLVSSHRSLVGVLGSRHSHLELTGMGLFPCGFAGPAPLSSILPPGCTGTQFFMEGGAPLLCWQHALSRLAPSTTVYFSTQDRTKISLSQPSSAAVMDITPATPVVPGPSAVPVLKPRRLQLLLL